MNFQIREAKIFSNKDNSLEKLDINGEIAEWLFLNIFVNCKGIESLSQTRSF